MKRVFAFLVSLVILLATFPALGDAPSYLGTWVCTQTMENSMPFVIFQLTEDHKAYYLSQLFFPDHAGMTENAVYTWEEINDQSFRILADDGARPLEFNMIDQDHLTGGIDMEYIRCGYVPVAPAVADHAAEESPVGMWSFYWDARELNKMLGSNRMSFDLQSYSLFLLDDGAAFLQHAVIKDGKKDFFPEMLSGIWIGNNSDITIKVDDLTFKAWIDSTGRLFLKMTDQMALIFQHIAPYDYEEGFVQ